MGYAQRKKERRAMINHLLEQQWNIFGTLKFVDGRRIGRESRDLLLRSYWNKIDHILFGRAAERQRVRVPRWCFAHTGADSDNFHVHYALSAPLRDVEQTCMLLNAVWAQYHYQTGPLAKNWVTPVQDRRAVAEYLTREYWRLGSATFLDHISWDQTPASRMAEFRHEAQAQRISRAASLYWLRQAQQAYEAHMANTKAGTELFTVMERG